MDELTHDWTCLTLFERKGLGCVCFYNKFDVDKILHSEPSSFDKHLVVMKCYENNTPLDSLKFDRTNF